MINKNWGNQVLKECLRISADSAFSTSPLQTWSRLTYPRALNFDVSSSWKISLTPAPLVLLGSPTKCS